MAKDILFEPRVETTERMTRNGTKLHGHFVIQESTRAQKLHLSDMYVLDISCLHSTSRLKT